MGTQFKSRLSPADCRRIKNGIQDVKSAVFKSAKKTVPGVIRSVGDLPNNKKNELGDTAIGKVLTIIDSRKFFVYFDESRSFREILSFFKEMQKDARYSGFQGVIRKMELGALGNPIPTIVTHIKSLTLPDGDGRNDPFRVAASNAARGFLVEIINVSVKTNPGASQAEILGKKVATFEIRDIVVKFITRFIFEFISDIMNKADPSDIEGLIKEVIGPVEHAINRMAKRAVEKIHMEEKLCNTSRIHQIVLGELKMLTEENNHVE